MTKNIFQFDNRQDKFGYYLVGDLKFYSKHEAIEAEARLGRPVKWIFNDEVFSSYDWSVEPTESLSELYRQRAQELRDSYDYLIVNYSSGSDSDNILNTFIENDIKLDEVVSWINYEGSKDKNNILHAEVYYTAIDRVKKAQEHQPNLKHRLLDLARPTVDFFNNDTIGSDWIYNMNGYFGPHHLGKNEAKKTVKEWQDMFNAGKKVAFITGIDKPLVYGINGSYYFMFSDIIDNAVNPGEQRANHPWSFEELFYWAPSTVTLMIKQGHVLKNYLKSATDNTKFIFSEGINKDFHTTDKGGIHAMSFINKKQYYMSDEGVVTLIYPNWKDNLYTNKGISKLYSLRDDWFYKISNTEIAKHILRTGLNGLWERTPDTWKNDPTKMLKGFKKCNSKPYYLGN